MRIAGVVAGWFLLFTAAQAGGEPWSEAPSFSVSAADVLHAVQELPQPKSTAVEVLLYDTAITIDAEHRRTMVTHVIYRVLTQDGVEGWSAVREMWAPERQKRPVLRARVISADGTEHDLDPATLTEAPLGSEERTIFTDRRVVEGPLPGVALGCVVETEATSVDEAPFFGAGVVTTVGLDGTVPVRLARVRVVAPASLPLETASHPRDVFTETEAGEGTRQITAELRGYTPPHPMEGFLPPDQVPVPSYSFATGSSWASVASAYAAVVDRQIASARLDALARKVTAGHEAREEKILAIIRYVHDSVRYTGVEFGSAGLVPESPETVLKRKYGDCKDKAALVVALLREAGILSHLALLQTGFGPDVEPALPGLGAFDHAIVRVDGNPALWIDATAEHMAPGVLPLGVDGRLALVVREGTSVLERVPEAAADTHRSRELREFFLAEEGPARVVESTTAEGRFAAGYREQQVRGDAKALEDTLLGYAKEAYGASRLDRFSTANVKELARPFELRLEIGGAGVGKSSAVDARVTVPLDGLASDLARAVPPRAPRSEAEDKKGEEDEDEDPLRRSAFYVFSPYVTEWTYRIHPPPGFVPLALPAPVERAIGPASLRATFAQAEGGTVTVEARFTSGPRQWTAEQYEAGRRAMHDLERESPWAVSFEQVGEAHLRAGRLAEALAEFRRLAALHPTEALHHDQIASVLMAAGLGEAARREARLAVGLEPESALAQQRLGMTLMNDTLGREFRAGADLAGAEAALRKAKELDPESVPVRALLALVLEHDSRGIRYGSPQALERAIAEFQALRAAVGNTTTDGELLTCLGRAGRARELQETATQLEESVDRNRALVAAAAMLGGVEAARAEAGRWTRSTQTRRELLAGAGLTLFTYRRYSEARMLLQEGLGDGQTNPQLQVLVDVLGRTRRNEEVSYDRGTPEGLVRDFFRTVCTMSSPEAVAGFLAPDYAGAEAEVAETTGALRNLMGSMPGNILTPDMLADLTLSVLELEQMPIGDLGYQVVLRDGTQGQKFTAEFVIQKLEGGRLAVLASPPDYSGVGRRAEHLLAAAEPDAALRWLTYVRGKMPGARVDDPIDTVPMAAIWSTRETDPLALRTAALALQIGPRMPDDVVPSLETLRTQMPEAARWKADLLLTFAHSQARRHAQALHHAEQVLARFPDSSRARGMVASEMLSLGRIDEAEARIAAWVAEAPDEEWPRQLLLQAAHKRADVQKTIERFNQMQAEGRVDAIALNNQAWFLLAHGRGEDALPLAERAVRLRGVPSSMHTLACVQADVGRLSEAKTTVLQRIERFEGGKPGAADALVFGRIAEHLGEPGEAAQIYRRALPEMDDEDTRKMTEVRLGALPPTSPSPAPGRRDRR